MQLEVGKLLRDIQEAIESTEDWLEGKKDFSIYIKSKMLSRAVEREFEVLGEAMGRIDKPDTSIHISSTRQISICEIEFTVTIKLTQPYCIAN